MFSEEHFKWTKSHIDMVESSFSRRTDQLGKYFNDCYDNLRSSLDSLRYTVTALTVAVIVDSILIVGLVLRLT